MLMLQCANFIIPSLFFIDFLEAVMGASVQAGDATGQGKARKECVKAHARIDTLAGQGP
jgi:hypothetical protein